MSVPTETKPRTTNPLLELSKYGQSPWLDYIRRNLISSGELKRLIEQDGLAGVTSNPAIFEKAITGSTDYTDALLELQKRKGLDAMGIYEILAIKDIQDAADTLRPVYDRTKMRDGYVSLEVSPFLAKDTDGTIKDARRLWKAVNRPNLMVKVPATPEGIPAIQQLIGEGININVTLLFAQEMYEKVAHAYITGLKAYAAGGGDPSHVASVASFFISRIDTMVDAIVKARLKATSDPKEQAQLKSLLGKVAIANGKLTYQRYKEIFSGPEWDALAKKGAQTQRVLWASTSTKDPSYSDVLYVEELIGPDTVDTIPPATFDAFRDHGHAKPSLEADLDAAQDTMDTLESVGISMKKVTDDLVTQAVKLFAEPFDKMLNAVDAKCKFVSQAEVDAQTYTLGSEIGPALQEAIEDWKMTGKVRRLWARDASLWTGTDEANWMGWLGITEDQLAHKQHLEDVAADIKAAGFTHALLLGMGGSSLCPEVLRMTFGKIGGYPDLHVLDSTDPAQVKAAETAIDIANTIFIVSSKSGSTLEPNIFKQYFFERVKQVVGADKAGSRFIAITDPGSKFEQVAQADHFRHIFHGVPSIGGRYSALSDFGMVPAAVMGMDAPRFLDRADVMAIACSSCLPVEKNPGVLLGLILGVAAKKGRDKVTLIASPGISDFGAWLEQLLAESTGKDGKGLIPVDREPLGPPEVYSHDRVFAYIRLEGGADPQQDQAVDAIAKAGHPVVRIALADKYNLGQEMFRWEIATAVAGSVIGINTFNQPDVEASKVATRKLTSEYEKTGSLPPESPILSDSGIDLYTDEANLSALSSAAGSDKTLVGYLRAHLSRIKAGDYFALLGYIQMNEPHEEALQEMRTSVRDKKRVATCLGFGPRFLHSTGQAYKGGPNTGVFLQVTSNDKADLPVPGQKYTFGVVKAAQARGDFQVLADRRRRALRVHLHDVEAGLKTLEAAINKALSQ
ncbi:MAG TPA: bifunctional transaldolase/phosoglucose isomerase [Bryobacteraceae bacterium]|nr:bifunctional transaldolase/phosoglucose isomerase [Bryobacteraceae bacterium]